jgi:hypothetical protein
MARRFLSTARRLQRLESSAFSAHHTTAEHDLQRRQGEWQTRFLHTLTVAELERLEHWLDGHLCDTEEREVAKWHEAIVQTYVDRTGDSPPNSTVGESS